MRQIGRRGRDGRRRIYDARAPLGPADVRRQRPLGAAIRERGQDGLAGRASANSAFASCPIRTPRRSPPPLEKYLRRACAGRASSMELIEHTARRRSSCRSTALTWPRLAGDRARFRQAPRSSSAKAARFRSSRTFRAAVWVSTSLLLGWGQDDDNTHSPNEKFCLADFHRGIKASAYLWNELSHETLK